MIVYICPDRVKLSVNLRGMMAPSDVIIDTTKGVVIKNRHSPPRELADPESVRNFFDFVVKNAGRRLPQTVEAVDGRLYFGGTELDMERPETWGAVILAKVAERELTERVAEAPR